MTVLDWAPDTLPMMREQVADAYASGLIRGPYDPPEPTDEQLWAAISEAVMLSVPDEMMPAVVAYLLVGPDENGDFELVAY